MFQRKGTVSKSSGPVHVNSYALRGIPIKYTPPFPLPDLITLPASWKMPTLPSDEHFRYDYYKEKQVLEQVRVRTMSLAAEAEAREKIEKAEEERRRIEAAAAAERAKITTSTAYLHPPLIPSPGSAILTPTQAPPPSLTKATPTNSTDNPSVTIDSSPSLHIRESADILKPLGEMSLSEFEGNNFNPFDTASLQAINDMEILQTISLAPPPLLPPPPASGNPVIQSDSSESEAGGGGGGGREEVMVMDQSVMAVPSRSTSAPAGPAALPQPPPPSSSSGVVSQVSVSGVPIQFSGPPLPPITAGSVPSQPSSLQHPLPPPPSSLSAGAIISTAGGLSSEVSVSSSAVQTPTGNPFTHPSLPSLPVLPPIGTAITLSHSAPINNTIITPSLPQQQPPITPPMYPPRTQGTPPLPPKPSSDLAPYVSPTVPVGTPSLPQPDQPTFSGPSYPSLPPLSSSATTSSSTVTGVQSGDGGIGTLIAIESAPVATVSSSVSSPHPTPTPTATQTIVAPVPKPRSFPARNSVPNNAHPTVTFQSSPTLPSSTPSAAMPSIQSRAQNLISNRSSSQPTFSRSGLGVSVLPPIPNSSSSSSSSSHPVPVPPPSSTSSPPLPPYRPPMVAGSHSDSPPPPYYPSSSPSGGGMADAARRSSQPVPLPSQQHNTPSHFTLPDPTVTLLASQRSEVESMSVMGFPGPRVARAVKRFKSDHTQVVDFLIMVGGLEEASGSKGDSAEVALTVCENNEDKAKRYLQKVSYYRESGFNEAKIHEAYEKAGKDWDKALDILTSNSLS